MDSIVRFYLISLLSLVSVILQAAGSANPNPNPIFASKTYVEINNQVPANVTVHCKSRDDDLGNQVLIPQGRWGFRFRPNIFIEDTLFFCSFAWWGRVQFFDIYVERRDEYRCNNCIWRVKPDGPCLRLNRFDACYPWKL